MEQSGPNITTVTLLTACMVGYVCHLFNVLVPRSHSVWNKVVQIISDNVWVLNEFTGQVFALDSVDLLLKLKKLFRSHRNFLVSLVYHHRET